MLSFRDEFEHQSLLLLLLIPMQNPVMKEQSRSVPAVPKQKSEGIIREIKKSAVAIEKHTCIDFLPVIILQVKLMAVD